MTKHSGRRRPRSSPAGLRRHWALPARVRVAALAPAAGLFALSSLSCAPCFNQYFLLEGATVTQSSCAGTFWSSRQRQAQFNQAMPRLQSTEARHKTKALSVVAASKSSTEGMASLYMGTD